MKIEKKQSIAKRSLIRFLKLSKKQFYDEDGKEISVPDYVDWLLRSTTKKELENYKEELKKGKDNGTTNI